ncbi:hypothetical protein AA21952_1253 [Acetobacter oeni LMG 21952]|nr:hypothetical protein AA21952_1253 [Acetobacter oeni LMG 21952]
MISVVCMRDGEDKAPEIIATEPERKLTAQDAAFGTGTEACYDFDAADIFTVSCDQKFAQAQEGSLSSHTMQIKAPFHLGLSTCQPLPASGVETGLGFADMNSICGS